MRSNQLPHRQRLVLDFFRDQLQRWAIAPRQRRWRNMIIRDTVGVSSAAGTSLAELEEMLIYRILNPTMKSISRRPAQLGELSENGTASDTEVAAFVDADLDVGITAPVFHVEQIHMSLYYQRHRRLRQRQLRLVRDHKLPNVEQAAH